MGSRVAALIAWALLSGCAAVPPPSPPPAVPPPAELVPLRHLFASRDSTWGYRVSPDGTRLAWLASHARRATVHVRALDTDVARSIDTHSPRHVFSFEWARDSRRILYLQDEDGDENYHIYLASIDRPDDRPVDLTPVPGSRAFISRIIRSDPRYIVIGWNRRDRSAFDLYRVNLDTHETILLAEIEEFLAPCLGGRTSGLLYQFVVPERPR